MASDKKNHTFSFSESLIEKAKVRADQEGRSLTNYIESLMRQDQKD